MSENSLSGALPPSWGEMRSLEEMWIEYNNVSEKERVRKRGDEDGSSLHKLCTAILVAYLADKRTCFGCHPVILTTTAV